MPGRPAGRRSPSPTSARVRGLLARPRVLLALVGAVLTLVVGAVPAAAHDVLTGTTPAAGANVGATPGTVVLTFDRPAVAMGTQVLVTGPTGQVQVGAPRLVDSTVTQDVGGGAPAGAYTVAWRITSADGHPVSGTFTFTSAQAGAGTAPAGPSPSVAPGGSVGTPGSSAFVGGVLAVLAVLVITVVVVLHRRVAARRGP